MNHPGDSHSIPTGNGGQNDLGGLHQAGRRLRPDHGPHTLPYAGPSALPAGLCLAGLRSVPEVPGAAPFPGILAGQARGPAPFGHGRAFEADQAGRAAHRRWGPAAPLIRQGRRARRRLRWWPRLSRLGACTTGAPPMARVIRLQSDSNAHDRPWRVAVEQGFFAAEGLTVEYNEDNPQGVAGRVENFSERWKESQLQQGALEVYPVCEWGAIERVQSLGKGRIIGLDTTARTGAIMVRKDSKIETLTDLRNVPIAVTWHAGTFYAAIEVLEAAGVAFDEIKLVHANDRLDALLSGKTEAAALMEPLVSRAREAGCRQIADLRWRGGIVAGDDVDEETAAKTMRALNRAVAWLSENESRSREELLRDLKPELRKTGLLPELMGVQDYKPAEFQEKVNWMMDRGFLKDAPAYDEIVRGK